MSTRSWLFSSFRGNLLLTSDELYEWNLGSQYYSIVLKECINGSDMDH